MKLLVPILCVVLGFASGIVGVFLQNSNGNSDRSLSENRDLVHQVSVASDQILAMREEIAKLTNRDGSVSAELTALRAATLSQGEQLNTLAVDVANLRNSLGGEVKPAALKLRLQDGEEERLVDVDEYIEARINRANNDSQKQTRRRQFSQAKPFIKMGMTRQVDQYKKRLNLNETQTERMTESFNSAFDKTFPSMEIVMDPDKSRAEKEAAAKDIQNTLDGVNSEAQTYLDGDQYRQFAEQQQQNNAGLQAMITSGINGGGMPFPFGGMGGGGTPPNTGTQGQN